MTISRGSNPLDFSMEFLKGRVVVTTKVTGPARDLATCAIFIVHREVWSRNLTQDAPWVKLEKDITVGDVTILEKDLVFTLTIPTSRADGDVSVVSLGIVYQGGAPHFYTGKVASWKLTGQPRDDFAEG